MSDLKQLLESIYGELEHGATTSAMAKLKSHIDKQNASICAENAALRADERRLNWLETKAFEHKHFETGDSLGFEWTITSEPECDNNIRAAIDAAIKNNL